MKKSILAFALAMAMSRTAFADFCAEPLGNGIKITGQAEEKSTLFIYAPGYTPKDFDGFSEGTEFSLMKKIIAEDSFPAGETVDKSYIFDDNAVFGKYIVYIKSQSGISDYSVEYINYDKVKHFLEKVNDETADKLGEFISFMQTAAMDAELFSQLSETKQEKIVQCFANIDSTDEKEAFAEIKKIFAEQMLVAAFEERDKEFIKRCISEYGAQTELFPDIYSSLNGEEEKVIDKIIGTVTDKDDLKKQLFYYSAVYGANVQDTWKKLKDYVTSNSTVFKNTDGYSDSVWNSLINILPINNADDIYLGLEKIQRSNASSSGSGGASGSGGGNKSNSSFVNIPTPSADSTNKNEGDTNTFSDVKKEHWAYDAIEYLAADKIISGYQDGSFKPNDKITREQAAVILVNAFYELKEGDSKFIDVKPQDWFAAHIATAGQKGIISGYGDVFGVGQNITRQDFAVILYRILCLRDMKFGENRIEFKDFETVSDYAKEAVQALAGENIISGQDGLFMPSSEITRAEAAQMIYSVLHK